MTHDGLTLKIVTPDEVFFEGPVRHVMAPGALGYLGILKGHAPFVTTLTPGRLVVGDNEGKSTTYKVESGFLEVLKNRILVLVDKITP